MAAVVGDDSAGSYGVKDLRLRAGADLAGAAPGTGDGADLLEYSDQCGCVFLTSSTLATEPMTSRPQKELKCPKPSRQQWLLPSGQVSVGDESNRPVMVAVAARCAVSN